MKVGVTGGAGFIGGHVVDRLFALGHEPVIFDRRFDRLAMLGTGHDEASRLMGDIRDGVAVTELAAHVEGIIHLASVLGTQETVKNPRPAVMTNVAGFMNVAEACVAYELPMVNICVGNAGMSNPYSASKTCAETLGHMYRDDRGLRINQVRAVNAYGPRQSMAAPYGPAKVRKILPAFIARALTWSDIEVYGDGQQVSDMVHVADVAAVLVHALEAAAAGTVAGRVVEVGPDLHHTVNEIADLVGQEAHYLGYEQVGIVNLPMRPGERPGARVTCDPATLADIGYTATLRGLTGEIRDVIGWYAEHWRGDYLAGPGRAAWLAREAAALLPEGLRDTPGFSG